MNHSSRRWLAPILLASACTSSVVDDASSDKSAIQCAQNTAIEATFLDTADHWAGFAAEGLRDAGIVDGRYGRNDFEPAIGLTRAEWAAMLAQTIRQFPELLATEQWRTDQYVQDDALGPAGAPEEACTEGGEAASFFGWRIQEEGFDSDHWAYKAICSVVSLGVMTGDYTEDREAAPTALRGTSVSAPYPNIFWLRNHLSARAPAPTTFRPDAPLKMSEVYASVAKLLEIFPRPIRLTRNADGEISHPLFTLFGRDKFYNGNGQLDWFAPTMHGFLLEGQLVTPFFLEGEGCDAVPAVTSAATRGFAAAQLFTSLAAKGYLDTPEAYLCRPLDNDFRPRLADFIADPANPISCDGETN